MLALADVAVGPMTPRRSRVRGRRRETPDTVTLWIEPLDGDAAPFRPGQFNMLYAFGVGEVPISFSGDPGVAGAVHTIRAAGAVTRALCAMPAGATLGVRGPFGTGWDLARAEGRDVVVLAGGIGLAPLRSAVYEILARRDRFGRVSILVGARSPDLILYRDELLVWQSRADLHVGVTVDAADPTWRGDVGVVTQLLSRAPFDPKDAVGLVCGPEVMLRVSAATLVDAGVSPDRIRVSLERNMKCAIGQCGHCQFGPVFVCRDGPVFPYERVASLLNVREL